MHRYFNTEGYCNPDKHYMVNIDNTVSVIKSRFVDRGSYFVINRGRQYGKTTTLRALAEDLKNDYLVLSMDFQNISTENYLNETRFSKAFSQLFASALRNDAANDQNASLSSLMDFSQEEKTIGLNELFIRLSEVCRRAEKPMVLLIDEVDSASNNQVFIDFLALLRGYYLDRENKSIFHSVILAGVYDIKNLKLKLRTEREHQYNSPWNIAARFNLDMSFSSSRIASMLQEYEKDHHVGMDVTLVSDEIYQYTSGYPYLISAICKILDEEETELNSVQPWTQEGIAKAIKIILGEQLPLFDSMMRQLAEYPDMKRMLYAILFQGRKVSYNQYLPMINQASMFGYIINRENSVRVANRIFEMLLYNLFLSEEELTSAISSEAERERNQFVKNGRLDMRLVLEKFVVYYGDIYGGNDAAFLEEHGRKIFLLYLKPIINGMGNYYIEAQTRDARRIDVIVDYLGERFIIEMKIWRGNEYNERREKQLSDYLDYFRLKKGYMLSFNFNKHREIGVKEVVLGDKLLIEAVV